MFRRFAPIGAAALVAGGLAIPPAAAQMPALDQRDPLEQVNRSVFGFNQAVKAVVLTPASGAYRSLPPALQRGVDNVFSNLREPVVTVASALQGDGRNTAASAGRFLVNSTAGLAGLLDVATPMGLVSRPEDLGLTLCHYGVDHGPYLVLPFVGPSSTRDFAGLGITYFATSGIAGGLTLPFFAVDGTVSYAADGLSLDQELTEDFYVLQREAYLGMRALACEDLLGPNELKASPYGRTKLRASLGALEPAPAPLAPPAEPGPLEVPDLTPEPELAPEPEIGPETEAPAEPGPANGEQETNGGIQQPVG